MENKTIAAISTALSEGGIGIIRLSGEDSFRVVDRIYRDKQGRSSLLSFKTHSIHYGFIYDSQELIDEVMVSVMKAPNTFTKEDVVEINCHGGIFVCKKILELVIKNGASLAEPGEFTKRAFLNGRIDLSRAEAVMDLISSKNSRALDNSVRQLSGRLYERIESIRGKILYEIAFIESALDDPEHISLEGYPEKLKTVLNEVGSSVDSLKESFKRGRFMKEGINTVIVGKPNVGKSSLLNLLSGYERAIVTEYAGTTRDVIEQEITIGNISLNLIDTAGIRDTDDYVENIGVERAKNYLDRADLVLFTVDTSVPLTKEDRDIASLLSGKKVIIVLNKMDKEAVVDPSEVTGLLDNSASLVRVSALEGSGLSDLEKAVTDMFFSGSLSSDQDIVITSLRHLTELEKVSESLSMVQNSIDSGLPEDFFSIDLNNAYSALSRIIGEEVDEDLVNEIFSKFCMGK